MEEGVALIAQVVLCFMVECEKELLMLMFSDSLLEMMLCANNKEDRAKGNVTAFCLPGERKA